eukprot:scaffold70358_cov69-Cyclotella_meneghiniana.AAC.3
MRKVLEHIFGDGSMTMLSGRLNAAAVAMLLLASVSTAEADVMEYPGLAAHPFNSPQNCESQTLVKTLVTLPTRVDASQR